MIFTSLFLHSPSTHNSHNSDDTHNSARNRYGHTTDLYHNQIGNNCPIIGVDDICVVILALQYMCVRLHTLS